MLGEKIYFFPNIVALTRASEHPRHQIVGWLRSQCSKFQFGGFGFKVCGFGFGVSGLGFRG